jgi:hypothetical protein
VTFDEIAPRPWRLDAPNQRYMQIVDANGNPICDFFPFAAKGGRGWQLTKAVAELILEHVNVE